MVSHLFKFLPIHGNSWSQKRELGGNTVFFFVIIFLENQFFHFFKGSCGGGSNRDCEGFSVILDCCEGHLFSGDELITK